MDLLPFSLVIQWPFNGMDIESSSNIETKTHVTFDGEKSNMKVGIACEEGKDAEYSLTN